MSRRLRVLLTRKTADPFLCMVTCPRSRIHPANRLFCCREKSLHRISVFYLPGI